MQFSFKGTSQDNMFYKFLCSSVANFSRGLPCLSVFINP